MKLVCLGAVPEAVRIYDKIREINSTIELLGFLDNDERKWGKKLLNYPIFGGISKISELNQDDVFFCNLVTHDAVTRYETSLEMIKEGAKLTNFLHPNIDLNLVQLGIGNYIQESVILQANVGIGNNSSIHIGSLIGHETKIGNSVFIAHGCNLSGSACVEDGVFMGTGVSVVPNIIIGKWSIIGAGAVILSDIPPYSVVVGNPGTIIKNTPKKYDSGDVLNID